MLMKKEPQMKRQLKEMAVKNGKGASNLKKRPKKFSFKRGNIKAKKVADESDPEAATMADVAPIEIQFARKLAANEPVTRDRAMRKLKKWLKARSKLAAAAAAASLKTSGVADGSPDQNPTAFTRSEMMRLWKGLHYCFWMSDKPLVQEELAETLGKMLLDCFETWEESRLYAECFFVTLGREWAGIDRHRIDKYMMLTRRVLRQLLLRLAKSGWAEKPVAECAELVVGYAVLRLVEKRLNHPPASALGFQMHFVDIFLEELAKALSLKTSSSVDADEGVVKAALLRLLGPFVEELGSGTEERLLGQIEERVFLHLIQQSECDDDDEEDDDVEDDEGDDDEEDGDGKVKEDKAGGDPDGQGGLEEGWLAESDPRAGKGDVVLPQIEADFGAVAKALMAEGGKKSITKANRVRLYRLAKHFLALADGTNPFDAEDDALLNSSKRPKAEKIGKAAKRAALEEQNYMDQARVERTQYLAALKRVKKADQAASQESPASYDDEAPGEGDEEDGPPRAKKSKKAAKNESDRRQPMAREAGTKKTKKNLKKQKVLQSAINGSLLTDQADQMTTIKSKRDSKGEFTTQKQQNSSLGCAALVAETGQVRKVSPSRDNVIKDRLQGDASAPPKPIIKKLGKPNVPPSKVDDGAKTKKKCRETTGPQAPPSSAPKGSLSPNASAAVPKKKTKKKQKNAKSPEGAFKVCDEWDEPLQPGEVEIFVPNKNYSGDLQKMAPKMATSSGPEPTPSKKAHQHIEGKAAKKASPQQLVGGPKISALDKAPVTPVFIKRAMSKLKKDGSATPDQATPTQSKKLAKRLGLMLEGGSPRSEPLKVKKRSSVVEGVEANSSFSVISAVAKQKKSINFAMTQNRCSSLTDIDKSIQESPSIPFDASRKPKQGVLKCMQDSAEGVNKSGGSVAYNTMVNGRSKFARRSVAADFF